MFKNLWKAIQSENIKNRRSKIWIIILICAGFLPLSIFFFSFIEKENYQLIDKVPTNWLNQAFDTLRAFTMVFLPMGIVLLSASINSVEHKNNTWQLIETQPVPRWSIFLAKYLKLIYQVLWLIIIHLTALIMVYALMYLLMNVSSAFYFMKIEWGRLINYTLNILFGSMSFTALIFVFHFNVNKTNVISTTAIIAILGYTFLKVVFFNIPRWIPIVQLDETASGLSEVGEYITYYSRLSIVQSIFILSVGFLFFRYKSFDKYFFRKRRPLIIAAGLLSAGALLSYSLSLSRYQKSYGHTIIAGLLNSDKKVDSLTLIDAQNVQILSFPINEDGSFHVNLDNIDIPKSKYGIFNKSTNQLITNNYNQVDRSVFFMTNGDSIYLDIDYINSFTDIKISGDRRAESSINLRWNSAKLNTMNYKLDKDYGKLEPEEFISKLEAAYNDDIKGNQGYRTVDGFALSPDIYKRNMIYFNLQALQLWKKYLSFNPEIDHGKTAIPPFIEKIKGEVDYSDASLTDFEDFVTEYFVELNGGHEPKDTQLIYLVDKIENTSMRDAMRYQALNRIFGNASLEDSYVVGLYETEVNKFTSDKYKMGLHSEYLKRKSMMNFDVLPDFKFRNDKGTESGLKDYIGHYLVLDLWASWCMPCKQEAPYFSDFADKYKDQNILFISISLDEKEDVWLRNKPNNPHIINLHTQIFSEFTQYFGVNAIPRFILISPEGRPLNHQLPPPSDRAFETILKQYIH